MHACIIQPITFTCTSFDVLTYIMYNMHWSFVGYVVFSNPIGVKKLKNVPSYYNYVKPPLRYFSFHHYISF